MKKTVKLLLAVFLAAALFAGCGTKEDTTENKKEEQREPIQDKDTEKEDTEGTKVEITIKDYGTIKISLDAEAAPLTVENFLKLTKEGFYDGLTFHRIMNGFMMQGGDPEGNGTGGSDETIKGEFAENGVDNPLSHTRGAISMARSQDYDSASSQFFIVHEDSTYLDGQYAAFGYVTEGMDVVDKICETVPAIDQNGTVLPENQPVIESIKIMEN
ncbi:MULTISPECIES: peptidylprolyl isomerase [Blautia]|uniref:Peptidyl-prolyl cis-trans isomerase n=1 Tax=Blautia argi TaxID=1912897 RepID=A0A2Z4UB99_9FIRM|nr:MULTISPECIES: peptidylprolyl isomerase [Blautia]AWY98320.1 peptidylprolyl isomerase [Blautia argi]